MSDTDDSAGGIGITCTPVDELEGARIGYTVLRAVAYLEKLARGRLP